MENWKKIQENLKIVEKTLPNVVAEFSIEQIHNVQNQLKKLEEKVKEYQREKRVKTITISEEAHTIIKKYCVDNNIKINEWVEKVLIDKIEK